MLICLACGGTNIRNNRRSVEGRRKDTMSECGWMDGGKQLLIPSMTCPNIWQRNSIFQGSVLCTRNGRVECVGGWQSGGWLNSKRIWRIWNSINAVQISPCGSHWSQEEETVSHWCHLFSYLAEEILFGKYLQNVSRTTPHGILS